MTIGDQDKFRTLLGIMLNKSLADQLDQGERESVMDAIKADYQFCLQFEDQLKLLGMEVPKANNAATVV